MYEVRQSPSTLINRAMKSLSRGVKLSSAEEHALRRYKAAVAELQAYSDTELAELGINRSKIFKYALVWQLDYDQYLTNAAA